MTAAVVAIGLLGASVGATFTVLTGSGGDNGGCTSCSAEFGRLSVDPAVTYGQYLSRFGLLPGNIARALRERVGVLGALVTYEVTLRGKGKTFPVSAEVVDAATGNVVAQGAAMQLRADSEVVKLGPLEIWLPRPKQSSLFRVTLRVFRPGTDIGAQALDSIDTANFAGAHSGPNTVVTFTVRKSGTGSGVVIGPDLTCGTFCASQYGFGSTIKLLAVPHLDSVFGRWEGACGTDRQCSVVVGPITSIRARFDAKPGS